MKMPLIIPMYLVGSTENIKVIKRFCVFAFQTYTDVRVFKITVEIVSVIWFSPKYNGRLPKFCS